MIKFPIEDIKDGYLLKVRDDGVTYFVGVYHNQEDELCASSEDH